MVHEQGCASILGIGEALKELKQDRTEENCLGNGEWTRRGMSDEDVAIAIWKSWCDELERILRVGIIFLFHEEQHPAEVYSE